MFYPQKPSFSVVAFAVEPSLWTFSMKVDPYISKGIEIAHEFDHEIAMIHHRAPLVETIVCENVN